jgi:hypothetical protein
MPRFTPPLEAYIGSSNNLDKIIEVYLKAFEEFFTRFPSIDGIMLMTGEVGGTHNIYGDEYYGETIFDSADSLYNLLSRTSNTLAKFNKTLIYRAWSIGIGDLGNLHSDPTQYHLLFDRLVSYNKTLIVSIKYVIQDFYRYLPFNPNFGQGSLRQMVEVEGNPEYGGLDTSGCCAKEKWRRTRGIYYIFIQRLLVKYRCE